MGTIIIYQARITRDLLRQGFRIVDIKPNPQNKDRTIFLFEDTPLLRQYIENQWDIAI
jgi:hypothetical protein